MGISTRSTSAVLGLILVIASPAIALAKEKKKKATNDSALVETQHMLTTPSARQKVLDADPRAKAMDSVAEKAVGQENMAEVYELASELMGTLAAESEGDSLKMMELLQAAQKDPRILESKFTPEQRARIKKISERLPAAVPGAAPGDALK